MIASNLPGVRRVVDNGINGLLVEPQNIEDLGAKINYLIENPNICKKMGINGREKILCQYSWPKIAKDLEKIYSSIEPISKSNLSPKGQE